MHSSVARWMVVLSAVLIHCCAAVDDVYVSPTAQPGGDGSFSSPFSTIRAAVDSVKAVSRILLLPGVYMGPENLFLVEVSNIRAVQSTNGPEETEFRGDRGGYFGYAGAAGDLYSPTITGVAFSNFPDSAALAAHGVGLLVTNCTFEDSAVGVLMDHSPFGELHNVTMRRIGLGDRPKDVPVRAGVVWVEGTGFFRVFSSSFTNSYRGVFVDTCISVTLQDCIMSHNVATAEENPWGAGVWAIRATTLDVKGSSQLCNNAAVNGSAIYAEESNVFLRDTVVESNRASMHGGAVYATYSSVRAERASISDNSAMFGGAYWFNVTGGIIEDSSVRRNIASRGGGIVAGMGAAITFTGGDVTFNASPVGVYIWCTTGGDLYSSAASYQASVRREGNKQLTIPPTTFCQLSLN